MPLPAPPPLIVLPCPDPPSPRTPTPRSATSLLSPCLAQVLREAGMLCNPRTPASVLRSQRNASLPAVEIAPDGKGTDPAYEKVSKAVRKLRSDTSAVKVLHINGPLPDYRSVLAANTARSFERTVSSYGGLWCCNRPPGGRGAGHIWYDFLWDVIPHRDRHNREWDREWTVKMGP